MNPLAGLKPWRRSGQPNRRKLIFTCNACLIALVVLLAAVVINAAAFRFNVSVDLTRNKLFSLSEPTLAAIKELNRQPNQVAVYGFFSSRDGNRELIADLLQEFKKRSGKLSYQMIDPYKNPVQAKQFQIQELGTLVFVMGGKQIKVLARDIFTQNESGANVFAGEPAISRTIYQLLDAETQSIYLLTGHGEKKAERAVDYLKGAGYRAQELDLMKQAAIPEDCAMLTINGPRADLTAPEAKLIEDYLGQGGRLLLFLDFPPRKADLPNLARLTNQWGIDFEDGIVIELERRTVFDYATIIPFYMDHGITRKLFESGINLIFPVNRALSKVKGYAGDARVEEILQSSKNSWVETNPSGRVQRDAPERGGPIALGYAASRPKQGKVIVLGTASFVANEYIGQGGNLNFLYNMVHWISDQQDRVSVAPKIMDVARVPLTPPQAGLIRWFALLILPALILGLGGAIWVRRRAR